MFVRNDTTEHIALARGHVSATFGAGAIVVENVYEVHADALARSEEPPPRGPSGPPDTSRVVLWREVSVTAAGTAYGPSRPPHVCPVSLTVGEEIARLIVFGPRWFRRGFGGDLEPSKPEPFEGVALSWERAFGGGYLVPPGLAPGSGLPHPGMDVRYPLNPSGIGFYEDKQAAADKPLPDIERPDQLIRRWDDRPTPAGFSPCPELNGLRFPVRYNGRGRDLAKGSTASDPREAMIEDAPAMTLRMQHHAPGDLVFSLLTPGTAVALVGLGRAPVSFRVPPSPISVRTRRLRQDEIVAPRLRSLHIDADRRTLSVVYDHAFRYDPAKPPSWVRISTAS
jgi:hypothetical protein